MKNVLVGLFVVVASVAVVGCASIETVIDARLNRQLDLGSQSAAGEKARALVASAFIADLHADTLLFERGLEGKTIRGKKVGIIDAERLLSDDVALQVLSTVSEYSVPVNASLRNQNGNLIETKCNQEVSDAGQAVFGIWPLDMITLLYRLRHPFTAGSRYGDLQDRILDQADRFQRYQANAKAMNSPETIVAIQSAGDLAKYISDWRRDEKVRGVILAVEGLHFYRAGTLDTLWKHGFRMASLTHHFDNQLAAASNGCHDEGGPADGLRSLGETAVEEMRAKGWVLDLAHASGATIGQALKKWPSGRPPVVSHTGIQGLCEGKTFRSEKARSACEIADIRNISKGDVVRVAKAGGVVGVMYWPKAVEPENSNVGEDVLTGIVESIIRLHGILLPHEVGGMECPTGGEVDCIAGNASDHIALGSDWDGAISTPIGTGNIEVLVDRLMQVTCSGDDIGCGSAGAYRFDERDIRAIVGWNVCRVLMQSLPDAVDYDQAIDQCVGVRRNIH